ncbi:hypothetical protein BDA99DRAFT_457392, partial [Phascolomyces articulosus]
MATSEDHVDKRIYIGGLHSSVDDQLIRDRFGRYGTIGDITIAKDVEGNCRGFGHFNINTTPKQWAGCLSLYNGAKWKGQIMRLEDAKMDYMERKRKETEQQQIKEEKQRKKRLRIEQATRTVMESKDMALVTDRLAKQKRGWRLGRYGRGIAMMRLKKPDGTQLVFDPKLYANNLTKLYDMGATVKPVHRLPMYYEEPETFDQDTSLSTSDSISLSRNDKEALSTMNKDNEKRLAAMERRIQEEKQRQEILQRSFMNNQERSNHVTFEASDDENEEKERGEEPEVSKTTERPAPRDSKWMFDSDEEDGDTSNFEIKINPALEGEKGRELLELQSKFKGDDRFKLSEEFKDDDDEEEKDTRARRIQKESDDEPEDEISKTIAEEKNQSMDLLRAMFGDEKVEKTKPKEVQWSFGARYDPEAEDADDFLRKPKEEYVESDQDHNQEEHDVDDDEEPLPGNTKPVTAMPVVSTEKHFEVNVNMKPLFGAEEAEPFKLFGGDGDTGADDDNNEPLFGNMFGMGYDDVDHDSGAPSFAPKQNKESHVGLGVLFFFHTNNPALMKKSCFGYDPKGSFQRTDGEDYEAQWREKRPDIGEILKKRQKQAVRRHKKLHNQGVK